MPMSQARRDQTTNAALVAADDGAGGAKWNNVQLGLTALQAKDTEHASIADFNAVGDGVADDTVPVQDAEASTATHIDLLGLTVRTTLLYSAITKNYYNGTLLTLNASGNTTYQKPAAPLTSRDIARPQDKSPILDWAGKKVLWLGTSIAVEGGAADENDAYPALFANAMDCNVDNLAWAGSAVMYDPAGDPFAINTVKKLAMTEDDRLAGLALHGGASAYADGFDPVTNASQMTADYRIRAQFQAMQYDCVILDHAHNDRLGDPGDLNPAKITITAIATGATTTITAAGHGLAVGDGVALEVVGLADLNYAAARVQSVAGDDFVINIDSTAYAGAFVSGDVVPLDRTTIYGAYQFAIYYILNCFARYSAATPTIIMAGAPLEYTAGNTAPDEVYSMAEILRALADKWGLAFFDIAHEMNVPYKQRLVYFADGTHPTTRAARQAIANYWVKWASGGEVQRSDESQFLRRGTAEVFAVQREAMFSKYLNGFGTPPFIAGADASILADDFGAGLGTWSTTGTAPTVVADPWGGAGNAVKCAAAANVASGIYKAAAVGQGVKAQFDLYLPDVTDLTAGAGPATVTLARIGAGAGPNTQQHYGLQLIIRPTRVELRAVYFKTPSVDLVTLKTLGATLEAATKYTIRLEAIRATADYPGALLLYVNDAVYAIDSGTLDSGQGDAAYFAAGILSSNTGQALELYLGNVEVSETTIHDYTARFTGTFTSADAKTVTVVNGVIMSAV